MGASDASAISCRNAGDPCSTVTECCLSHPPMSLGSAAVAWSGMTNVAPVSQGASSSRRLGSCPGRLRKATRSDASTRISAKNAALASSKADRPTTMPLGVPVVPEVNRMWLADRSASPSKGPPGVSDSSSVRAAVGGKAATAPVAVSAPRTRSAGQSPRIAGTAPALHAPSIRATKSTLRPAGTPTTRRLTSWTPTTRSTLSASAATSPNVTFRPSWTMATRSGSCVTSPRKSVPTTRHSSQVDPAQPANAAARVTAAETSRATSTTVRNRFGSIRLNSGLPSQ